MMRRLPMAVMVLAALGTVLCSGCGAYVHNRVGDLLDCADICLTFTARPGFALHTDYFNATPMGISYVPDGHMIGLAQGQLEWWAPFSDWSWGWILWGSQQRVLGSKDPNPAPRYNVSIPRQRKEGNGPPDWTYWTCRRNIHLGWVGLYASMKPLEWADFWAGVFGKDICHDDLAGMPDAFTAE